MKQRWTDDFLNGMRHQCDPVADDVIREIESQGALPEVNRALLNHLVTTQDVVPRELPDRVRNYFETAVRFPEHIDAERIANAQRLFFAHAGEMCWLLTCASLPTCYACERGAKVLMLSKRISDSEMAQRRIFETAQFVLDVMSPDLLSAQGRGLRTIQKVRLMHASIRYYIQAAREDNWLPAWGPRIAWDPHWGEPINQEDLANTLMSFSVTLLKGLERFGHAIDPQQAEDYVYLWNQIGLLLGVDPSLIPDNRAEAELLLRTICNRNWEAGEAGTALTKTLLAFAERLLPGTTFDGLAAATVQLCFEASDHAKDLCSILNIPKRDLEFRLLRHAIDIGEEIEGLFDHIDFAARFFEHRWSRLRLCDYIGRALMQAMLDLPRGGTRPSFQIPTSLSERLQLPAN